MGLLTTEQELRAPARARAAAPTLGVEEELLLLDPAAGQVIPAAPELLARLGGARWAKAELMRFQFEAVTDICTFKHPVARGLLLVSFRPAQAQAPAAPGRSGSGR